MMMMMIKPMLAGYFGSFFFFLDLAGTVSLVLDIPWLFQLIVPSSMQEDTGMASGAKAARGARAARMSR